MKYRYEIDGRNWVPVSRAAKLLGTNAQGIRKLMGDGALEWRQTRANSRTFVVDEAAVLALRKERPTPKLKRSPGSLASKPTAAPARGSGNDIWFAHHLRLTLPRSDEETAKKTK